MNKKFLSVILFSALMVGTTGTFTSCKDYDDDIENLDKKSGDLNTQLTTLQSALDAAKSDIAAAKSAADAAKEAAATAKAEALQAAIDKVNEMLKNAPTQEALDALKTQISAIETNLATISGTVDANASAINQLKIQMAAVEKYKALINANAEEIDKINAAIAAINKAMEEVATTADVKAIDDKVTAVAAQISGINDGLVTLIGHRLTSVTLVPDLYVDGIETIEFLSLKYRPMVWNKEKGMVADPKKTDILVSSKENPAHYRLSPANVNMDCIDKENIEFLAYKAQTRGVVSSPIRYVKNSAKLDANGIMTVFAEKSITGSLNLTPEGQKGSIYTVALKVPIKEKYRTDKEADECVYSEYSRLAENTLTPKIAAKTYACKAGSHQHYYDSLSVWNMVVTQSAPANVITKEVLYNGEINLNTLVTGCIEEDAREITAEELAKYGLEFKFAVPTTTYNTGAANKTNQQEFAKLKSDGCTLISKLPNGALNNKAAIDKEPIVRVTLWDKVNKEIVDQRYLKIRWIDKTIAPVDLGIKAFKTTLGCGSVSMDVTWKDFINTIYGQIKDEKLDMSEEQFHKVYPYDNASMTYKGKGEVYYKAGMANMEGDALVLQWIMQPEDIGTIVKYAAGAATPTLSNNEFTCKITFKPTNNDYPVLTYTLKNTVELPKLPSINGYYEQYWFNPYEAHDVLPVQYNTAAQTLPYCVFNNNLMNAFTYNNQTHFIVKDMTSCGAWDMQFSLKQEMNGVKPTYWTATATEPLKTVGVAYPNFEAYSLLNGSQTALEMRWDAGHASWCNNPAHYQANLFADHNNAANQSLLNPLAADNEPDGITPKRTHNKKIQMSVWATINPYNYILVKNYSICLVAPLRIESDLEGYFEEGLVSGSSIDCSKAFKMTDFRGYEVAEVTTNNTIEHKKWAKELFKYYEVGETKWDLDNVRYGMKVVNGTIVIDNNLTAAQSMTAAQIKAATNGNIVLSITQSGKTLVFKNNGGSNVETKCNVFIPATVTYGFGKITTNVKVPLYPKGQVPQN